MELAATSLLNKSADLMNHQGHHCFRFAGPGRHDDRGWFGGHFPVRNCNMDCVDLRRAQARDDFTT
jgi:hypothetical protein